GDWQLMDEYAEVLKKINHRYNMKDDISLSMFLNNEEFISIAEKDKTIRSLPTKLLQELNQIVKQVVESRKSEGRYLHKEMEERQNVMHEQYKDRIKQRIEASIDNEIETDQRILIQEIALLAEKGDIAEEITRLNSHIKHFHQMLNNKTQPIGRNLEFITQEMHREINTVGSKSVDTKLSECVVHVKSEIEKLK